MQQSSPLNIIDSKSPDEMEDYHLYAFDLTLDQWAEWFASRGFSSFHGKQVYEWIYAKGACHPSLFTNLPLKLRELLAQEFRWDLFAIHSRLPSADGSEKLLLKTPDNLLLEMVVMPYENRITLCLSCQVGCRMGCHFCQTGKMGFKRNLTSGEILSQVLLANQILLQKGETRKISNVVFMGMGEPLDNYAQVVRACRIMIDKKGLSLSKNKVTVSTSGLIPEIYRLGKELPVRLAISLHAATDEKRSSMMPINKRYPLAQLKKALMDYPSPDRFGVTLEYVMIEGKNDSIADAKQLVKFIHGMKAKVNLIPINHFPGLEMKPSQKQALEAFQKHLSDRDIPAPIRYSKAQDVSGGCGQLAAKAAEDLHKDPRALHKDRRAESRKI